MDIVSDDLTPELQKKKTVQEQVQEAWDRPPEFDHGRDGTLAGGFLERDNNRAAVIAIALPKARSLTEPDKTEALARLEAGEAKRAEAKERAKKSGKARAWPRGKSLTKGNKVKLAVLGIDSDILNEGNPEYAKALRTANSYRKHRQRELAITHGYLSAGASALLATASLALASSRYVYAQVVRTGDISLLKTASALADSARQNELAAYELCAREAVVRKKTLQLANAMPWLTVTTDAGPVEVSPPKKGRGRPRKDSMVSDEVVLSPKEEKDVEGLPEPGGNIGSWLHAKAKKEVENARE